MEKMEKKKRTSNFTEVEKMLLVDLINEKKHIIECKVTNRSTIQGKEKCWKDITNKFNNASSLMYRDTQSLRNCWDNIKKRKRKFLAQERKETFKTGGGRYNFEENSLASKTKEVALSEVLVKNEMERHSIEMAISEQKLIREKLEVDVLKTELEIKKTILMREKSKNATLGMLDETE